MDDQKKGLNGVPLNYSKSIKVEKGAKLENHNIDIISDEEASKASQDDGAEDKRSRVKRKASPEDDAPEDIVLKAAQSQPAPGGVGTYKSVPSGGTVFMDGLCSNMVPIGDPYSGLPDG